MRRDSEEKIVKAAKKMFFEKGYEGTSMRMIATEAGCAVGLAYNYFPSKEELLNRVLKEFLEDYNKIFDDFLRDDTILSQDRLYEFFQLVERLVHEFRNKYNDLLHWTIRLALRDRVLGILEPYVQLILEMDMMEGMPKPKASVSVLAIMITHGIGSLILHDESVNYADSKEEIGKIVRIMLGNPSVENKKERGEMV